MASILVVCTGNVCRSPMAEGFLRAELDLRLGPRAPSVASAGTAGWERSPAMPESVEAAAEQGVDISGHRGHRLTPEDVRGADLVVAMAGEHREAVERAMPEAAGRTFTLKELVRLLEALPPDGEPPADPRERLVERVAAAERLRSGGFSSGIADEDVADPLGLPVDVFRAVAWELQDWCARLVEGVYGRA